jgi:four helix bundle protein
VKNETCPLQSAKWGAEAVGAAQLSDRLLQFAVRVGTVVEALPDTRLSRHIAGQLVRCGTSPAPNYEEACAAESRADFVHKLRICLKELRESRCWLRLITESRLLPKSKMEAILDECEQLMLMVAKSIVTAKTKMRKRA